MEYLKQQFDRIQQQINGLNASQKMLTAALVAIMVMTIAFWARYAGQSEMQPLLDQSFTSDDIGRITTQLAARRVQYRVEGDRIFVPASRKFEVLAELGYAQLLPRDTRTGFEEIARQMSPWNPHTKNQALWNKEKELSLAQVIRLFPNVADAVVIIDPTRERRVGSSIQPRASVNINMRGGIQPDRQLIEAAADVVAGAQAGLSRSQVHVVVDGRSYPIRERNEAPLADGNDLLKLRQSWEGYFSQKIKDQLSWIDGALVAVSVELNTRTVQQQSRRYDPNEVVHRELETTTRLEETTSSHSAAMEAGVGANVGFALPEGGGGGSTSMVEETQSRFGLFASEIHETSKSPAGDARVASVTVRIPRSHFVRVYRQFYPDAGEPDNAVLQPLIDDRLPKIRRDVMAMANLWSEDAVVVETYTDVMPVMAAPSSQATSSAIPPALSGHAREIALGVLAVISLLLISMMVKKSGPAPAVVVPAADARPAVQLASGDELAGEVAEVNPLLDGMELDEEAVRAQQMVEQVSTLVRENPDAAANLVKRWLNRV